MLTAVYREATLSSANSFGTEQKIIFGVVEEGDLAAPVAKRHLFQELPLPQESYSWMRLSQSRCHNKTNNSIKAVS